MQTKGKKREGGKEEVDDSRVYSKQKYELGTILAMTLIPEIMFIFKKEMEVNFRKRGKKLQNSFLLLSAHCSSEEICSPNTNDDDVT